MLYVTGTDTGIGKTWCSTALLHALRARGMAAVGMKPVASGCTRDGQGHWVNEDALALQAASSPVPAYADLNPFALPEPLAPELAAQRVGTEVTLPPLLDAFARLRAQAGAVVVEGVGGWDAPLSPTLMQADLARALDLPVVLVVGLRLGCLSHALLTARAIAADGLHLAGWIGNTLDPPMDCLAENIGMLRARLPVPCWGVLPWAPGMPGAAAAGLMSLPAGA